MKIGIRQQVLIEALEKGATAATSDVAQTDTSNLALLMQSIKITADKNLTIESNTNLMSVKYIVPVTEDSGVVIKEEGCIVVPAKDLINWVKVQGKDSTISMILQKLETPEIINTLDGIASSDEENNQKFSIKKIGTVKIGSKDTAKTNAKWELDCYAPEEIPEINYNQKAKKNFDIKGGSLIEGLNKVLFAALPNNIQKHLEGISIQVYEKNVYLTTTDLCRVALCKIPSEDISDMESEAPILIIASLLGQCSKIIDKSEKVTISYSEELGKVYITQDNLKIRLASADKVTVTKFPNVQNLFKKKYESLTEVSKNIFNSLLTNASVVNNSCALFSFNTDEKTLTVKAVSAINKNKPCIINAKLDFLSKNAKVVWGVSHIMDGLKVMKEDDVTIGLPENLKSVRFTGKGNDNFIYFAMSPESKSYASDMSE